MDDKKSKRKIQRKKNTDKSQKNTDKQFQKVSVYTETKKRKEKSTFKKQSPNVSKKSKYIFLIIFFGASYLITRITLGSFLSHEVIVKKNHEKENCPSHYKFTPVESELLKITKFINKPKVENEYIAPCSNESNSKLANWNLENRSGNETLDIKNLSEQLKIKGKINKLVASNEDSKLYLERMDKLKKSETSYLKDYSRFKIKNQFPEDGLYFGVESDKIIDIEKYLESNSCEKPSFSFANNEISHLGLFFTLNAPRGYKGRVKLIEERFKTIIKGKFGVYEYRREPFHRYIPDGFFEMWIHESLNVSFKSFNYQRQFISGEYRFDWDRSPWLYNSCHKSMATISNYCGLDPSFDMQYKDFFYSLRRDMVLGNIYCKRSHEEKWTRVGIFEFVRTN